MIITLPSGSLDCAVLEAKGKYGTSFSKVKVTPSGDSSTRECELVPGTVWKNTNTQNTILACLIQRDEIVQAIMYKAAHHPTVTAIAVNDDSVKKIFSSVTDNCKGPKMLTLLFKKSTNFFNRLNLPQC